MLNLDNVSLHCFADGSPSASPQHDGAAPSNLSSLLEWTRAALDRHGHAWIRGFDGSSPSRVQELARMLAPTLIRYPGGRVDVTADGTVQRIADPPSALVLHCELAYTPFRPDLCLFACAVPAKVGGATLIADGAIVWQRLSDTARQLLLARRIRYARVYRTRPWRVLFGVETIEELAPLLGTIRDFRYEVGPGGAVRCEYLTAAATRVDGRTCFANSIVGLAKGHTDFDVTWEDGEPIAAELIAELAEALRSAQVAVDWAPGDIVVLDNWRTLHGREAFEGEREVFSAFGYVHSTSAALRRACG
jgi:alpha-ketoglutarate-dependent taurine dioxygenase